MKRRELLQSLLAGAIVAPVAVAAVREAKAEPVAVGSEPSTAADIASPAVEVERELADDSEYVLQFRRGALKIDEHIIPCDDIQVHAEMPHWLPWGPNGSYMPDRVRHTGSAQVGNVFIAWEGPCEIHRFDEWNTIYEPKAVLTSVTVESMDICPNLREDELSRMFFELMSKHSGILNGGPLQGDSLRFEA